ncbi:hypothetical protein HWD03_gp075 [Alteromonas phage vB_AmeM_PT11-V22]|uniref:Uncharacterized protein n=1 Tax=Alteromonas phage vB_AmeM_PT11-V22 TaxID=2704031 RepID=A0A6C0R0P3_9CAUD|nr:hypothetical protein HWD03_gp075 [Alteromonas phage vB_AmeM_PT11-V22]QHZ59835.1 hypothetical protein [Alteromonas phage vB_AmeM_PT11-V22]
MMSNQYGIFHSFGVEQGTPIMNTHLYLGDSRMKMFTVKDENFKGLLFSYCKDGIDKKALTLEEASEEEQVTLLFDNRRSLSNTIKLLQVLHDQWEWGGE